MKNKLLLFLGLMFPIGSQAASLLTGGHIDGPAFGYYSAADVLLDNTLTQGFEAHFHNEGGADGAVVDGVVQSVESEYEPNELIIVVPKLSVTTHNSIDYYWLPESEAEASANNTPFLGIGLEELNPADWTGSLTLSLVSIVGPGDFLLWQDDGLGGVNEFLSTAGTSFSLLAGSHSHYSWGFTQTGDYDLVFQISGEHATDGFQMGEGTYKFHVVPEPSTALLGALGVLALMRRRK